MAALPYIQFYVADYLADTMHLHALEHGAYLLLLMNYWQTRKPLKNDDERLSIIARCTKDEWAIVKESIIEFFEEKEGFLFHKRMEADLKKILLKGYEGEDWKGYVYFICNSKKDKVKIGYSKNPWARLKDLQTASSDKLLLVATVVTTELSEKKIHKELSEYLISGEWFFMSSLISDLIFNINDKKITTVDDSINYCRNYGITTVETTKYTNTNTNNNSIKENKKEKKVNPEILEIFEHWQKIMNHPKAKLDQPRIRKITQALSQYSAEDLKKAIEGCSKSSFHQGQNETGEVYDDIEFILRNNKNIEKFIIFFDNPPIAKKIKNKSPIDIKQFHINEEKEN